MSYDYSENILVQESAGNLLKDELGWDVRFAYNTEILGKDGTFGRESYKEILLHRYFHEALKKLNPWINDAQISEAEKLLEKSKTENGFDGKILKNAHPALKNRAAAMILENFGFSFDFERTLRLAERFGNEDFKEELSKNEYLVQKGRGFSLFF